MARLKLAEIIPLVILAGLLLSEILIYAPPPISHEIDSQISFTPSESGITIRDTVQSTIVGNLNEVLYSGRNLSSPPRIYFYYDGNYPSSWASATDWFGLSQHLDAVFAFRHSPSFITILNATGLQQFLLSDSGQGAILICASGVLPYLVFSKSLNLVSPWINRGGTLIWVGDKIGFYSGRPGVELSYTSPSNPGLSGVASFVNISWFGSDINSTFPVESSFANAFDVNYSTALAGDTLSIEKLESNGGYVMGNVQNGLTTIGAWREGNGSIILFGGPTTNDQELAIAIANIVCSGTWKLQYTVLQNHSTAVADGETQTWTFNVPQLWVRGSQATSELCVYNVQTNVQAFYSATACDSFS